VNTRLDTFLISCNCAVLMAMAGLSPVMAADSGRGAEIYAQTCVACHGADGRGTLPGVPDFTSKSGPLSKGDSVLLQHITDGFQTPGSVMAMPPKGGNPDLTEDDVIDVLYYIRGKFGS